MCRVKKKKKVQHYNLNKGNLYCFLHTQKNCTHRESREDESGENIQRATYNNKHYYDNNCK